MLPESDTGGSIQTLGNRKHKGILKNTLFVLILKPCSLSDINASDNVVRNLSADCMIENKSIHTPTEGNVRPYQNMYTVNKSNNKQILR